MAAIREWFAAYGVIFDYMRETGGEDGLAAYLDLLGGELWDIVGEDGAQPPLAAIAGYFRRTVAMDGGTLALEEDGASLAVRITACPDHLYFREAPYDTHKFGQDYCRCCQGVYAALARRAGCHCRPEGPVMGQGGEYRCVFHFAGREEK